MLYALKEKSVGRDYQHDEVDPDEVEPFPSSAAIITVLVPLCGETAPPVCDVAWIPAVESTLIFGTAAASVAKLAITKAIVPRRACFSIVVLPSSLSRLSEEYT